MFAIYTGCKFRDCEDEHYAKGFCRKHYDVIRENKQKCRTLGCNNFSTQVYCGTHRQEFRQKLEIAQKQVKKKLISLENELLNKIFNIKKPITRQHRYRLKLRLEGKCPECGGKYKLYTKSLCKKCYNIAKELKKLKKRITPCLATKGINK